MASNHFPFATLSVVQTYRALEIAIQWTLDSAFRDVAPLNFTVEVSETPDFSVLLYSIEAGDNFFAIDDKKLRQGATIDLYYRVRLVTGSGGNYISPVIGHWVNKANKHLHRLAAEITRREFVRYRFTGHKGWVLKRRNYGIQDPTQLDPITGVPLSDQTSDYGTGFPGGYYPPVKISYSREAVENSSQLSSEGFGTTTQEVQKHRHAGFPMLEPYDIVVTDTNQRYRYVKVNATFMPGTDILLVQSADAVLLPLTDPIYRIPIPQ
ncbi:hypothetical protein EKK58_01420 [Candidatus Dependentiae bacterium]|nr:MAG: hypothetical protein EKK58_01420 [Candidatus Dependentiae bacterium]